MIVFRKRDPSWNRTTLAGQRQQVRAAKEGAGRERCRHPRNSRRRRWLHAKRFPGRAAMEPRRVHLGDQPYRPARLHTPGCRNGAQASLPGRRLTANAVTNGGYVPQWSPERLQSTGRRPVILLGWRAELCPRPLATPTMSRTAPTNAELAALARNHVYYAVAMLRRATSTTTTVRLPIRCQQATST